MKNVIDLTAKRILITGGSSGIGRETALLCSQLGARVVLVARDEEKLSNVLKELEGEGHCYFSFDLSELDKIEKLIKLIVKDVGKIDGLVHSAGVSIRRPLKMLKPHIIREVMDINFYSFIELVRCVTRRKNYNESMSVVGVSSIAAKQGDKAKTAYCASKAAMDASVWCMAKELSSKGIRVNTVNPSLIDTSIYRKYVDNGEVSEDVKRTCERQYMGVGKTIDVANMIVYLLSDAAKFITGSNVDIDGGIRTS